MDQNPRDRGNLYISESWNELKLSREIIILLNLFYKKNSKESIYIYIYIGSFRFQSSVFQEWSRNPNSEILKFDKKFQLQNLKIR